MIKVYLYILAFTGLLLLGISTIKCESHGAERFKVGECLQGNDYSGTWVITDVGNYSYRIRLSQFPNVKRVVPFDKMTEYRQVDCY